MSLRAALKYSMEAFGSQAAFLPPPARVSSLSQQQTAFGRYRPIYMFRFDYYYHEIISYYKRYIFPLNYSVWNLSLYAFLFHSCFTLVINCLLPIPICTLYNSDNDKVTLIPYFIRYQFMKMNGGLEILVHLFSMLDQTSVGLV